MAEDRWAGYRTVASYLRGRRRVHILADANGQERWLLEERRPAAAVSGYVHANLPVVLEVMQEGKVLRTLLEPPAGSTLEQVLRQVGPLPLATALAIALQVAGALEHLHSLNPPLIMGNLAPRWVYIGADGGVRVNFLGVSSPMAGAPLALDPDFAAPEVEPTARSDVYSLGRILATMLPPEGAGRPEVAELIARATHPDPAQRFRDGRALREALALCQVQLALAPVQQAMEGEELGREAPAPRAQAGSGHGGGESYRGSSGDRQRAGERADDRKSRETSGSLAPGGSSLTEQSSGPSTARNNAQSTPRSRNRSRVRSSANSRASTSANSRASRSPSSSAGSHSVRGSSRRSGTGPGSRSRSQIQTRGAAEPGWVASVAGQFWQGVREVPAVLRPGVRWAGKLLSGLGGADPVGNTPGSRSSHRHPASLLERFGPLGAMILVVIILAVVLFLQTVQIRKPADAPAPLPDAVGPGPYGPG